MPILHGASASPFVRKVRIALAMKGIDYEHDPLVPIGLSEDYLRKSPLGKIPCWEDGDFALPDSSAICAYLEALKPEPAFYPSDPREYGRALWFEEYADTKLADTVGPGIFFERVVKPGFMNQATDEARVEKAIAEELPPVFDYLEGQVPETGDGIVGGRFGIADASLGSMLAQLGHARVAIDAARWPRLAAYAERVHGNPWFKPLLDEERAQLGG